MMDDLIECLKGEFDFFERKTGMVLGIETKAIYD